MRRAALVALLLALAAGPGHAGQEPFEVVEGAGGSVTVGIPGRRVCQLATVTAYSVQQFPGVTRSGLPTPGQAGAIVAHGRGAADGLPFGTAVWIDGLGVRRVQDRGGGLSAGHFDVLMATTAEARQWGRQTRLVCDLRHEEDP